MNLQACQRLPTYKIGLSLCQWTRDIHALSRQMTHVKKTQAYMHGPIPQSPTNEDSGLSSLLSSMKAHRRAKAQQAYPSSKQAQVHARRPAGSVQIQSPSKVALHMKECKGDPQPVNHAILTFQPTPSIPLLQQYKISVPYLDAYSSISFLVMTRIREIQLFFFFFLSSF